MLDRAAPFIGREEALGRLQSLLARADEGEGSVVLISGEAGIGKTRLCEELRRGHEERGGHVVMGRAFPEDAAIAFAPLADSLRRARRRDSGFWRAARARADLLSIIVPELGSEALGARRAFDRPVLFEALIDAVEEARRETVSLWVLEDIHWGDDSTWEFVKYATRRAPDAKIVLAATYREDEVGAAHSWWARLAWLKREANVATIALGRLGAADTERLLRALAPSLPDAVASGIVERSAGTPLFVEELASLAEHAGALPQLPDVVRATVRERAARLDASGRDLLDVAAVAGRDLDLDVLLALRPEGDVDELVSAGLLEFDEHRPRFRHPLLGQAAYEDVQLRRRRALHAHVARAIETRQPHLAERAAAHLEQAGTPEAALAALEAGARGARAAGNVGRAASLTRSALALAGRHERLMEQTPELRRAAIADLFRAGRWSELDPLVREAWAERDFLPPGERAWLANVVGLHLFFYSGAAAEAARVLDDEIAYLEKTGSDDAAMSLAQASFIAWFRGDGEAALRLAERALTAAGAAAGSEAECRARNVYINALYAVERDRDAAAARHRDNAAFARARGLTVGEANALWSLSHFTAKLEDYEAAARAAERAGTWYASLAWLLAGATHVTEGRPDEAERIFVRVGPEIRLGIPAVAPWMDLKEAFLFLHRGELEQARRLLHGPSMETESGRLALWRPDRFAALGWLAWEEERWEEAVAHLGRCAEACRLGSYHEFVAGPIYLPLHVDALVRLGRRDEAVALVEATKSDHSDPDRFFGAAVAVAAFRADPSGEAASEADARAAAAPWPSLRAQLGCWRGELGGEVEAARTAHALFHEIAARRGELRAEEVLRRLGVRVRIGRRTASELSARELEIAALVAEGLSNAAIARRLYLSRPTVASHVAHILTKLRFSSRAQIAAWVAERRAAGGADETATEASKSSN